MTLAIIDPQPPGVTPPRPMLIVNNGENTAEAARQAAIAVLAANSATAAGRYFVSQAAGEAGSIAGQFFSHPDGAGGLVYRERTGGGSTIIGYAATKAQVVAQRDASLRSATASEHILGGRIRLTEGIGATLTDKFDSIIAYLVANDFGRTIELPGGDLDMVLNLSGMPPLMERDINVVGQGRAGTAITPSTNGAAAVNMAGCSRVTLEDFAIVQGGSGQTPIWCGRTVASGDANNNKFRRLTVRGAFDYPAVFLAAESTEISSCLFAPHSSSCKIGLWTGNTASLVPIAPPTGAAADGPNTDNRMIATEFHMPYDNAVAMIASRSVGWSLSSKCSFQHGAGHNDTISILLKDFDGGVWNGALELLWVHWEADGTNNYGVVSEDDGEIYGLSIVGGHATVGAGWRMFDYSSRTGSPVTGAKIMGGLHVAPHLASNSGAMPFYAYLFDKGAKVFWSTRNGSGEVFAPGGTGVDVLISADTYTGPAGAGIILKQQSALADPAGLTASTPSGVATADASDLATAIALANANKAAINAIAAQIGNINVDTGMLRTFSYQQLVRSRATGLVDS